MLVIDDGPIGQSKEIKGDVLPKFFLMSRPISFGLFLNVLFYQEITRIICLSNSSIS